MHRYYFICHLCHKVVILNTYFTVIFLISCNSCPASFLRSCSVGVGPYQNSIQNKGYSFVLICAVYPFICAQFLFKLCLTWFRWCWRHAGTTHLRFWVSAQDHCPKFVLICAVYLFVCAQHFPNLHAILVDGIGDTLKLKFEFRTGENDLCLCWFVPFIP